jgi:hypothetical protein
MPNIVTLEAVGAILQRVEIDLKELKTDVKEIDVKVDRLDGDVRAGYVQRVELARFVTLERYIWIERIVMAAAGPSCLPSWHWWAQPYGV